MRGEKGETRKEKVKNVCEKEIKRRRGWNWEGWTVPKTVSSYGTCA